MKSNEDAKKFFTQALWHMLVSRRCNHSLNWLGFPGNDPARPHIYHMLGIACSHQNPKHVLSHAGWQPALLLQPQNLATVSSVSTTSKIDKDWWQWLNKVGSCSSRQNPTDTNKLVKCNSRTDGFRDITQSTHRHRVFMRCQGQRFMRRCTWAS